MADTYNENEIVKLKHLNEFARQLNIKLDGGIDPKLDRVLTFRVQNTSGTNFNLNLSNDTFNIPLSYIQSSNNSVGFTLKVPADEQSRLYISDLTGLTVQYTQLIYSLSQNYYSWRNVVQQNTQPFTASFVLSLSENDTYKAWQKNIILNFVQDG